jgi:hypothetical protein
MRYKNEMVDFKDYTQTTPFQIAAVPTATKEHLEECMNQVREDMKHAREYVDQIKQLLKQFKEVKDEFDGKMHTPARAAGIPVHCCHVCGDAMVEYENGLLECTNKNCGAISHVTLKKERCD